MKKVLITGACGQLGRALVEAFAQNGAEVIATDLHEDGGFDKGIKYFRMDVTAAVEIEKVARQTGALDALINNAGIGIFTPFEERTEEEIDRCMDINLKGTILCTKIFSRQMIRRRKGTIINIGSIYGVVAADKKIYGNSGRNSSEIYAATKAGVIQLTKYFAAYLGEYGITVNAISPGGIFKSQKQEFVGNYVKKTALGRMAQTADLTGVACFLASDEARYLTGQNITVDGGFTLNQ